MNAPLLRVTDFESDIFSQCMAILSEAIEPSAQLPLERLLALLRGGDYQLLCFRSVDEVTGMALVYFSPAAAFAWLDYMAVRSDLRAKGVGTALFRAIVEIGANKSADWLLLEVDDPRQGTPEEVRTKKRRVKFYARLGAQLLANVPYWFPSAIGPPLPMRLMAREMRPHARLFPDYLRQAVEEIFENVHGRGRDDELLRRFRSNLPEEIDLEHAAEDPLGS